MKHKQAASPYMTIAETASYFRVSTTSIYKGRGVFAALRIVPVNGRKLVLRSSVEKLDRQLQQPAEVLRLVKKPA